ncbi:MULTISPECIES: DUF4245 domain-containing protein [Actinomycetes]|uniref:DUF4245 domain-containing protein n=1 Tax=Williamsia marianensis TaxID=85044 RepID=A0A315SKN0_WILMA|nr:MULTISPECIES: DUF4245 domain-containing protein [Actinomycetes]MCK0518081.1 DUF4245 domain-containing protein [Williamsia sp. DF01-3]MDV7134172.1 DUF4245 domain-containing protein [Williamsia muralis]PVY31440.1 uncharacterized protein DUF4245 [Williamsia marianensis]RKR96245.1 uncharacterized protein DUF4245 [Williamsia muralis]
MAAKPRILNNNKDMIWSLIPLLLLCAFIAVVSGNCSVGLTGGSGDDKVPAYDVANGLRADARSVTFPIRLPQTPADWKPNSGTTVALENTVVSNAGYITANGVYIQLSQTNATQDAVVGYLSDDETLLGAGTRDVGGRKWVAYGKPDGGRTVWVTDLGDVRIGLKSNKAKDDDFSTLASAVLAASPLPGANSNGRVLPTG